MPIHPNGLNLFGLHQFDHKASFFDGKAPLSEAVGYVIVIGFGIFFSVFTTLIVWIDYNYGGTKHSSEQFNTAGRTIKTGLIAVDIVSHWTWAATLLQSSNVAYNNGVSGPFWYASGATVQILLFGILAIELKRKAPTAHTILEIVNARWGRTAHLTFLFFCLLTNIIVTAMLLLGGAAVVNSLTGMNIYAAAMLIPIGVIMYTCAGGLKATFIASYVHTVILYLALCIFSLTVYTTCPDLGSPSKVYRNILKLGQLFPVSGNKGGSYLTFFSEGGLIFGIINVIGNFGTVFVDQGYWQSAIAAKPSASHKGYLLGGIMWFCIPFTLATTMAMAALALDLPITKEEAGLGLVPPAVSYYLLGHGGAILMIIMLFMAVTSAGSAELVAVSSLLTYDIYRTYVNPRATGHQIMRMSQYIIVGFGLFMGILAIVLLEIGLSLGWVYLFMGVVIGSAVIPIATCLLWSKATAAGAVCGAFAGQWAALITWLVSTKCLYGNVTVASTGQNFPMLAGNLVSILLSGIVCITMSLIKPDNYDWKSTREIPMVEDAETGFEAEGPDSAAAMEHARTWIWFWGGGLAFVLIIAWPCLALPAGIFSEGYYTFYVILSIIWGLIATVIATILPLWESRATMWRVMKHVVTCHREVDEDMGKEFNKPPVPHVRGGNPYVTPDPSSHHGGDPKAPLNGSAFETSAATKV